MPFSRKAKCGVTRYGRANGSWRGTLWRCSILTGTWWWASISACSSELGMNAIFAESEMRRYPLRARERELARHIVAMLDPYWYLVVGLDLGLLFGLYLYGAGFFLLGAIAVLLLYVCNYVTARVVSTIVERMVARRGGSTLLMMEIMALSLGPSFLMPYLQQHPHAVHP